MAYVGFSLESEERTSDDISPIRMTMKRLDQKFLLESKHEMESASQTRMPYELTRVDSESDTSLMTTHW